VPAVTPGSPSTRSVMVSNDAGPLMPYSEGPRCRGCGGSDRLPPGASLLEVRLQPTGVGTTVTIHHSGLPEPEATGHRDGWQHFLARLQTATRQ